MKGALMCLVFALAIPIVSFFTSQALQSHDNAELRTGLMQGKDGLTQAQASQISLSRACQVPGFRKQAQDACERQDHLEWMAIVAIISGGIGFGTVLLIAFIGIVSRLSRVMLFISFAPGLLITVLALSSTSLLNAGLAAATLYYGESALIGRIHFGIIAVLGVTGFYGAFIIIVKSFGALRRAKTFVVGRLIKADSSQRLWAFVADTAKRAGCKPPDNIVVGMEPNFYVTESYVQCLDKTLNGRTMYMSLPLCRILSLDEFKAVLGHELAHYVGADTKWSKRFYPIYRGAGQSLEGLASAKVGSGQIALLPAMAVFSYFLGSFAVAENRIGRERELAADKLGGDIAGAENIATSLIKVHVYSPIWEVIQNQMVELLKQEKQLINASSRFLEFAEQSTDPKLLEGLDAKMLPHPTDSHPPLSVRLKALGYSLSSLGEKCLHPVVDNPAILLIEGYEDLEKDLSEAEAGILANLIARVRVAKEAAAKAEAKK